MKTKKKVFLRESIYRRATLWRGERKKYRGGPCSRLSPGNIRYSRPVLPWPPPLAYCAGHTSCVTVTMPSLINGRKVTRPRSIFPSTYKFKDMPKADMYIWKQWILMMLFHSRHAPWSRRPMYITVQLNRIRGDIVSSLKKSQLRQKKGYKRGIFWKKYSIIRNFLFMDEWDSGSVGRC